MEQLLKSIVDNGFDKIVGIAIICLSAAVAWATFGLTFREKYLMLYTEKINTLRRLLTEMNTIKYWASGKYNDDSHNDNWFDPLWGVRDFPYQQITDFNWAKKTALYGGKIFKKLVALETAIFFFNKLLFEHREFIANNVDSKHRIGQKIERERRRIQKDVVNPLEIKGDNELTQEEKEFVKKCYDLNKSIHIDGIGNEKTPGKLHSTFLGAYDFIEESSKKLQRQRWFKPFFWAINFFAVVVAIIGLWFLISFSYFVLPSLIKLIYAKG
jgi:hypothetical protein